MKKPIRAILIFLFSLLVLIQFYQPSKNQAARTEVKDSMDFLQLQKRLPTSIVTIFQSSCYDCHSNHTNYDWFDYIQPLRSIVERHIRAGKSNLNFNEWGTYGTRKKERLLQSMVEQIETQKMPLPSYLVLHRKVRLNAKDRETAISWLKERNP